MGRAHDGGVFASLPPAHVASASGEARRMAGRRVGVDSEHQLAVLALVRAGWWVECDDAWLVHPVRVRCGRASAGRARTAARRTESGARTAVHAGVRAALARLWVRAASARARRTRRGRRVAAGLGIAGLDRNE